MSFELQYWRKYSEGRQLTSLAVTQLQMQIVHCICIFLDFRDLLDEIKRTDLSIFVKLSLK